MTHPNRDRWKEIIGPEYDTVVKSFLTFIREIRKDSEAKLAILPDSNINILIAQGNDHLKSLDRIHDIVLNNEIVGHLPLMKDLIDIIRDLDERIRFEPEKLRLDLKSLAEQLPEPSKIFFLEQLKPDKMKNRPGMRVQRKEQKELSQKKGFAILGAFICRFIFLGIDHEKGEGAGRKLMEDKVFLINFVEWIHTIVSQLAYQKTAQELMMQDTRTGIVNAVRVDKSMICSDIARRHIIRAQLSGDYTFLRRLAENLAADPLQNYAQYHEAYIVMRTFWNAGLRLLGPQDIDHFLTACGIEHPSYPINLPQFIKLHIRSIPGN